MKVLLSIKPEFAEKIFSGTKGFEFRKRVFKDPLVRKVVVYASSPTQMVIGEFEIGRIHRMRPNSLWKKTRDRAGITKKYFDMYFDGRDEGVAIEVVHPMLYPVPRDLREVYGMVPPQSFAYIRG